MEKDVKLRAVKDMVKKGGNVSVSLGKSESLKCTLRLQGVNRSMMKKCSEDAGTPRYENSQLSKKVLRNIIFNNVLGESLKKAIDDVSIGKTAKHKTRTALSKARPKEKVLQAKDKAPPEKSAKELMTKEKGREKPGSDSKAKKIPRKAVPAREEGKFVMHSKAEKLVGELYNSLTEKGKY